MKITDPNEVAFDDGIVYVICEDKVPFTGNQKLHGEAIYLDGEYDDPITLEDIAKAHPDVRKVIFDSALKGKVYSYGNHEKGEWEECGETRGYA